MCTRVDVIETLNGRVAVEVKASTTARMRPAQTQLARDVVNGTPVTPFGANTPPNMTPGVPTLFDGYMVTVPSVFGYGD